MLKSVCRFLQFCVAYLILDLIQRVACEAVYFIFVYSNITCTSSTEMSITTAIITRIVTKHTILKEPK